MKKKQQHHQLKSSIQSSSSSSSSVDQYKKQIQWQTTTIIVIWNLYLFFPNSRKICFDIFFYVLCFICDSFYTYSSAVCRQKKISRHNDQDDDDDDDDSTKLYPWIFYFLKSKWIKWMDGWIWNNKTKNKKEIIFLFVCLWIGFFCFFFSIWWYKNFQFFAILICGNAWTGWLTK